MAREAKEKTPAQKKVLELRQKLALAKEAQTKNDNEKTQAAVKKAQEELAPAVAAENRERFTTIAGARVKKIRVAMRNLKGVNSLRSYQFDESDVAKIESVLAQGLKDMLTSMRGAFSKSGAAKTEDDISFD
jgi:vacuolar-type H+-ATPase subunit D/Vma8